MSRESQSPALQAAVVIFAMLAVVLGVATFTVVRKCDDLGLQAQASQEETGRCQTAARQANEENVELKKLIGFHAGENLETIRAEFARDMETCGANLPEEGRFYRPALAFLSDVLCRRSAELGRTLAEIERWQVAYAGREVIKDGQIQEFLRAVAQSGADALAARNAADAERKRVAEELEVLQARMLKTRADANQSVTTLQKSLEALEAKHLDLLNRYKACLNELNGLRNQNFTVPHGQIRQVSYPLKTAWIDLGLADAVRQLLPFNVYPAEAAHLNRASAKGKIEVTKVLEEHLAEARIVEEKINDPLVRGDKIHSPGWQPGQR